MPTMVSRPHFEKHFDAATPLKRATFRVVASAFMVTQLAACAHYNDRPLPSDRVDVASLNDPSAEVLERNAATIDRPYLVPVALNLSAPLDRNGIAILAVLANPDLAALRARAGVSDAQVFAAGLLPDPTFSFGVDHILSGPDPVDNIAGGMGFSLSALRSRSILRSQAIAGAKQVRLDFAWAEWQIAENARLQAVRVLALRAILANAQVSNDKAHDLLERYLRAAGRGDIAADRVQAARIAATDAAANYRSVQSSLGASEFELRRLLGLSPDYPITLAPQPMPAAVPDASALFDLAFANRTDLAALRAGYDAQEAAVHKAVMDQFPNLDLSINAARDTGKNRLLGPSVGFTLPLWNRNRGGIAIEQATREALFAEYEARLFQTRAEIAAAVNSLTIAAQQRAVLLDDLPNLRRFAASSRTAANRGDLALATAEVAEQTLRDRELLLLQSEQAIAEQTIALELLVGAPQEAWPR